MGYIYDAEEAAKRIKELENENLLLKNKAEFLEFFNESSSAWEAFRDKDGKLFYLSPLFEEISGYSRNDFLSGEKELLSIAHPDDVEKLVALYKNHIQEKKNDDFDFRLIRSDGSIRYIGSKFRPVFDQNGEFVGSRISCEDFTRLKRTEEALKGSESKLKTIFNNSNDGIILIDEKGIITDWNSRTEKVTGLLKEEAIGNYVWDIQYRFIAREQKQTLSVDFLRQAWLKEVFSLKIDDSTTGYGEIVTIGGKVEYIEDLVKPLIIGNRRFYCIFQHYVTEQKHNERLLFESEDKFEKVFNMCPVPIALTRSRDIVYTEVNEAFCQLTGYKREEILGHNSVQLGLVLDHEKRKEFIQKIKEARQDLYITCKLRHRSGTIVDINASASTIRIRNEDYLLIIYYDISELKATEELLKNKINELAVANAELEQYVFANQELKQFAYTASHQLQEPIRTASNYVKIIEEDYSDKLDKNVISYLHIIDDATSRMSVLINTLLEFSRLGRDTSLVNVDCRSIVEGIIADLDYIIRQSGAIIETGDLPELQVYETEFRQLMQNLIINALKFQKKGNRPKLSISADKIDDKWRFSVSDNGIGINSLYFEKIFDIFQRLHNNEDEYEGKGVGLAFCKKIVQLHKGEIWVDSVPGKGSVFYFTIPDLKSTHLTERDAKPSY
jgi:PAS domain S-box-containing protein